jgi:hypothetical protein
LFVSGNAVDLKLRLKEVESEEKRVVNGRSWTG